ncbi:MAG: nitroreductase family protein [Firmicutes bacterium]|nr:nitroreductase family protein [Bacillota bacterium]
MNETIRTINTRRSIRSYRNEQITDEQLKTILDAGSYAPSGMGQQASMMVAVQDPEIIAQMSGLNAQVMGMDIDPFYGAPTVVVVFADNNRLTFVEDGSLVIGTMMLAAASIGVDSCWIHRAKETFETEEGKALMRKWGVPEGYVGIGNCILGYREGDLPEAAERKPGRIVRA